MSTASDDSGIAKAIKLVLNLQEQRVKAYYDLELALRALFDNKDLPAYQSACASITSTFSTISNEIRTVEEKMRASDRTDLATAIRAIQISEKEKLELTVQFHVEQGKCVFNEEGRNISRSEELRTRLIELISHINDSLEELRAALYDLDE